MRKSSQSNTYGERVSQNLGVQDLGFKGGWGSGVLFERFLLLVSTRSYEGVSGSEQRHRVSP